MHTYRVLFFALVLACVFLACDCLLNKVSDRDGHTDKLVDELQRNITTLYNKLEVVAKLEQTMTTREKEYNQTLEIQQQQIEDLKKKYVDATRNNAELQRNVTELQKQIDSQGQQNDTMTCQQVCAELEGRMDQRLSGYQVILNDVVDKQNNQLHSNTQTQSVADLTKQFHYLSISFLDVQKALQNQSKIIDNQQEQMSELEMKMLEQNQTIMDQQLTLKAIPDQQRKIFEIEARQKQQNQKMLNQQSQITPLRQDMGYLKQNMSDQQTLNQHFIGVEARMNESLSAYQVILHDLVDRQNQQAESSDNKTRDFNRSFADLVKQFHYLSLSVLDADKKMGLLNASIYGKVSWFNNMTEMI